jgi:hypothetical protein
LARLTVVRHPLLAGVPWAALVPVLVLALAFEIYCLVDLARSEVEKLPKWAWAMVILFVNPIGGIAYLIAGRLPR